MMSLLFVNHLALFLKKPASRPRRSSAVAHALLMVMGLTSAVHTMSRSVFSRMAADGTAASDILESDAMVVRCSCDALCRRGVRNKKLRKRVGRQMREQ